MINNHFVPDTSYEWNRNGTRNTMTFRLSATETLELCVSVCPFVCLSIYLSVSLSIHLSIYLSIYLSLSLFSFWRCSQVVHMSISQVTVCLSAERVSYVRWSVD